MYISKLTAKNFKSFANVTLHFDSALNVLTGVNNGGKTTVLEAVALWAECFRKKTWLAGRADAKVNVRRGDYRWDGQAYIDIDSVRCPNFGDIFHDLDTKAPIDLTATLTEEDGTSLDVGFTIRYAVGANYMVNLATMDLDFKALNSAFQAWPTPINVVYASPVAALLPKEDFETPPTIRALVGTRQSMQVLRNRLYQLKKDAARYEAFTRSVSFVLSDGRDSVDLVFRGDETNDVALPVDLKLGPRDIPKDISLLGSGTLQIIEIMLAVHAERRDLNIVLLDEPDSHIHRDIQRRLVQKLVEHTNKTQVFLTTHNESLIRSTRPKHLFHLEARAVKEYRPIYSVPAGGARIGLQPSRQLKILQSLGSETSIDLLNALEARRFVLVEGEDDARFVQAIVERHTSPPTEFHAMYWSFKGIDGVLEHISHYRELFKLIRNDASLWEKAVLILDRDSLNDQQRTEMLAGLKAKLSIPVYLSRSYTMEATVLSEVPKLKLLLAALMWKEQPQPPTQTAIDAAVDTAVVTLTAEIKKRVSDSGVVKAVFHRMQTRNEKLKALDIKTKTFQDASLTLDYQEFARLALANNQIATLANKIDVVELVRSVHSSVGAPFNEANLFERFIEAATPTTWFVEWTELAKAVQ